MQFTYQARDAGGQIRGGEIISESSSEAARLLRHDGLFLLALEEAPEPGILEWGLFKRRVSRNEIIYVTNQLSVMIDAGVPLANALSGLAKQTENPTLQNVLDGIQESVASGDDLSTALANFPKHFDSTYVNLVKASEASGTLARMLERIANQSRTDYEMRHKVRGALAYPCVMLLMSIVTSIFLLAYIFPQLRPIFEMRSIELPTPTRIMLAVSLSLTQYWYWWIVAVVAIAASCWTVRSQDWGRFAIDWCKLQLPVVGPLMRKVAISRSLRTLAVTINAGVPVLESLKLSANVANNVLYEKSWRAAAEEVATGRQIHETLDGNPLFPSTLLQMIASGEVTGMLGPVLEKVSDYYDREVGNSLKAVTSLIEPVMVLVMGAVIGGIAMSMLLPIFQLSRSSV